MKQKKECNSKIIFEGKELPYKIVQTDRRTVSISVRKEGEIIVRAPLKMKKNKIEEVVVENKNKIYQYYIKAIEQKKREPIIRIGVNETIPLYGKDIQIYLVSTSGREHIVDDGERIEVVLNSSKEGYIERAASLIEKWYRQKGKRIFEERAKYYAQRLGTSYKQIYIKDQKTCWGSCSNHKNLNFNWRLLMMPHEILDYCVVHELSHTLEMNHSKKFWAHVSKEFPSYKTNRKYLKENGLCFRIE